MRMAAKPLVKDDEASLKTTLFILSWAFTGSVWSVFTQPDKTFPARVFIFQPLWIIRMFCRDATWLQDLLLFLCVQSAFTYSIGAWRLWTWHDFAWIDLHDDITQIYIGTFGLLGICGAFAWVIVDRGHRLESEEPKSHLFEQSIDEQLLPPLLIPSRTTHARMFPEKHAFSYSYLFVGIPIGMTGKVGSALSVDSQERNWFHVRSADHLSRGGAKLDLAGKLKRYLHTQEVTDRDYAFAYLVTAPRFLRYSFNPVSFWYLYDSDAILKYMILEVNNTFDERRMYLLKMVSKEVDASGNTNGSLKVRAEDSPKKLTFSEQWEKDFHVSPFNSRKGTYSLRAVDPLVAYQETGQVHIDNTIILRSSKDSPKVVARVWSEGETKEAKHVESLDLAKFTASWWWVGLATFPRIVCEAQKLFFRKKLHVWYRPEVADSSVGREYTGDERQLESFFRAFLQDAVNCASESVTVAYRPAHSDDEEIVMYSPSFTYEEDHQRKIKLQVLSPAFYSRFVHYAHTKEAFDRECLATDEKNRTIAIENAKLLPTLLNAMRERTKTKETRYNFAETIRWSWLQRLRCPPTNASYPHKDDSSSEYHISDIRSFGESELDSFAKRTGSDAAIYRRLVTKVFFAQRFALGIPGLVTALDWLLRISFISAALYFSNKWQEVDMLRPRELGPKEISLRDIELFGTLMLLANAVHIWSFVKG